MAPTTIVLLGLLEQIKVLGAVFISDVRVGSIPVEQLELAPPATEGS